LGGKEVGGILVIILQFKKHGETERLCVSTKKFRLEGNLYKFGSAKLKQKL
jgi:hypothetical protein